MQPVGVFVGAAALDLHYLLPEFPSPDTKGPAERFGIYAGGPATNAAITFAHLGGRAFLFTEIGCHRLGLIIAEDITSHGVELVDMIPGSKTPPMLSSIVTTADTGSRTAVASRYPDEGAGPGFHESLPADCRIVLVDGFLAAAAGGAARRAADANARVVLDAGSWKPGLDDLLPLVDIAICSAVFRPPGTVGGRDVIDYLLQRDVEWVAVTRGGESILYYEAECAGEIPVAAVPVVDTLGAGDVLHGAFCYYLASGAPFRDALDKAATVATTSTRSFGTRAWMSRDPLP
jgi:sugar/nucleoside kinase (ribokinase family)